MLSMIRQATKVPNGLLSWDEFFQTMMLLATYTRREMLRTIFDLFDTDGSGDIDAREFKTLTMAINQSGVSFPGNFSLALSHYDIDGDGVMSFEEVRALLAAARAHVRVARTAHTCRTTDGQNGRSLSVRSVPRLPAAGEQAAAHHRESHASHPCLRSGESVTR